MFIAGTLIRYWLFSNSLPYSVIDLIYTGSISIIGASFAGL